MPSRKTEDRLNLKIVLRRSNVNAVLPDESLEQVDTLVVSLAACTYRANRSVNGLSFAIVDAGPAPCRWSWISLPRQQRKRRGPVTYLVEIQGKVDFLTPKLRMDR